MGRMALVGLALLAMLNAVYAEADSGLPAAGTILLASPAAIGYRLRILLSPPYIYTAVRTDSSDPALAKVIVTSVIISAVPSERNQKVVREIDVEIRDRTVSQGQYAIAFVVTTDGGKSVERNYWLQIPAATIEVPSPLIVRRLLWFWNTDIESTSPQIWETTQRAWLTNVRLTQKGDTEADSQGTSTGLLSFNHQRFEIAPGSIQRIGYPADFQMVGSFPLGTSKGTIVVQADQLPAPVPFAFEVHSSLPRLFLLLVLPMGLGVGWLTRKALQGIISRDKARQGTLLLIAQVNKSLAANKDPTFQKSLTAIRENGTEVAVGRDEVRIRQQTTDLQGEFQNAVNDLQRRREARDLTVGQLKAITGAAWRVPSNLADRLESIRGELETLANDADINRSLKEAVQCYKTLNSAALMAARELDSQIRSFVTALETLSPFADKDAVTQASKALLEISKNLRDAANANDLDLAAATKPTNEISQTILKATHSAAALSSDAIQDLGQNAVQTLKKLTSQLAGVPLKDATTWTRSVTEAQTFFEKLQSDFRAETALSPEFITKAVNLRQSMEVAILAQSIDSNRNQVKTDLRNGDFSKAIDDIVFAKPVLESAAFERRVSTVEQTPLDIGDRQVTLKRSREMLPSSPQVTVLQSTSVFSLDVFSQSIEVELAATSWLLWFVYAAIITFGGYILFQGNWVGTLGDFATAFFWAYGIDVGSDAVATVLQRVAPK